MSRVANRGITREMSGDGKQSTRGTTYMGEAKRETCEYRHYEQGGNMYQRASTGGISGEFKIVTRLKTVTKDAIQLAYWGYFTPRKRLYRIYNIIPWIAPGR